MAEIREKIQKLLALADSPNENEARAALLKAKELMVKHKMCEDDFKKEVELKHLLCEDVEWTTDSGKIWMVELCTLIANNYMCTASWRTKPGTRTHTLMITGFEEDAKVCSDVMGYAIGFVENAVRILQRKSPSKDGKAVEHSYAKGFILGLELAFDAQKEEHPEWGLVVVKPKEVEEYENTLGSRDVKTKKQAFDPLAYMRGQKDGQDFNAQRVLAAVD
jgi:hypothetical protein